MTDENKNEETQETVVKEEKVEAKTEVIQEKPAKKEIDTEKVAKSAGYYGRNQEEYNVLKEMMDKSKGNDKVNKMEQKLHEMSIKGAYKDAIIEYDNLTKEDMRFIKGNTEDEIAAEAKAYSEHKASLVSSNNEEGEEKQEKSTTKAVKEETSKVNINYSSYNKDAEMTPTEKFDASVVNGRVKL